MTGEKLITELKRLQLNPYDFDNDFNVYMNDIEDEHPELLLEIGNNIKEYLKNNLKYNVIYEQYDDYSSDEAVQILHFYEYDIYLKAVGYYNSYEGNNWDGSEWKVVIPKQITINIYE
jgi:hypothetical protein